LDTVLKTVGKIEEMLRGTFRVRRSIRTLKARPQRRSARVELSNIADTNAGMAAAMEIATQMTGAFSSTAQDLQRGRLTEIDSLNGYIARRGAELGEVLRPAFVTLNEYSLSFRRWPSFRAQSRLRCHRNAAENSRKGP